MSFTLAIVGRPNVGKSTFVNALLGHERFVVSDASETRSLGFKTVEYNGQELLSERKALVDEIVHHRRGADQPDQQHDLAVVQVEEFGRTPGVVARQRLA